MTYIGTPPSLNSSITATKDYFQALDNFARVFAIRSDERVLMLTNPLLDPRVVDAIGGLAKARRRNAFGVYGPEHDIAR